MKTKTRITTFIFCIMLLILLVAFFLTSMYIYDKYTYNHQTFAISITLSELPSGSIVEETLTEEEVIEGGNWFMDNWSTLLTSLLGVGGTTLAVALIGMFKLIARLRKELKNNNTDNIEIKTYLNGMGDELNTLKASLEQVTADQNSVFCSLIADLKKGVNYNIALAKSLSQLVSASNLPDETKNSILGELNTALGYKAGDTNDKQG